MSTTPRNPTQLNDNLCFLPGLVFVSKSTNHFVYVLILFGIGQIATGSAAGWLAAAVPDLWRDKKLDPKLLKSYGIQPGKPAIQPASQSASQPASSPAGQPAKPAASQSTSRPASQQPSPSHPATQPTSQASSQPASQAHSQPARQPTPICFPP